MMLGTHAHTRYLSLRERSEELLARADALSEAANDAAEELREEMTRRSAHLFELGARLKYDADDLRRTYRNIWRNARLKF